MANPVELIDSARRRIARVTGLRRILTSLAPAVTALILAGVLGELNALALSGRGYSLAPAHLFAIRVALVVLAALALLAGGLSAWRAQRPRDDGGFLSAAGAVDRLTGAHLEVLTLAEIANPGLSEAERMAARTPLFPMLWRRAISHLENFNPVRAFPLEPGRPLGRSSLLSLALVIVLGIAVMALVRPPTPEMREALRLRALSASLEGTPGGAAMAARVRAAAAALVNPHLSRQKKLKLLASVRHDLEHMNKPKRAGSANGKRTTGGSSGGKSATAAGNGSGKGNGAGRGEGSGGAGKGNGNGPGPGSAKNNQSKNPGKGGKNNQKQIAEIEKTLGKAAAEIQEQGAPKNLPAPSPSNQNQLGNAPKPGQNPNRPAPGNRRAANAPTNQPTPGANANSQPKPGGNTPAKSGSKFGNTHLGEFPKSVRYQHYYKAGQKGPQLNIKDARFVVFRIPAAKASGGGRSVIDTKAPRAATPYTNAPLAAGELNTTPDERQLVPPRYRDLIR